MKAVVEICVIVLRVLIPVKIFTMKSQTICLLLKSQFKIRFEDICKSKYNYKYVRARIAIEDGLENDNGDPMLGFYLFADSKAFGRYMRDGDTRDNISELTYSFRDDGLYEDDEYFNGTTEEDLIDAVAESFAKALDASEY